MRVHACAPWMGRQPHRFAQRAGVAAACEDDKLELGLCSPVTHGGRNKVSDVLLQQEREHDGSLAESERSIKWAVLLYEFQQPGERGNGLLPAIFARLVKPREKWTVHVRLHRGVRRHADGRWGIDELASLALEAQVVQLQGADGGI